MNPDETPQVGPLTIGPLSPQFQPKTEPTTQPQQLQQGGLDPKAQALTKAIALQENGGQPPTQQSYLNTGRTGERGLYQFQKGTWQKYAGEILGNSNADPTPENQNQVAYGKVKNWLDSGKTPEQVASMWNAGEGAPNAYLQGMTGTTSTGAKYDVPAYANNVVNYYHQQLQTSNQKEEPSSLLGKIMDFAFPIISDVGADIQGKSKKSALQQLGDLGLSALWFVPGVGPEARLATKIAGGTALGYGADVVSKLSQGQTDIGQVLSPGLGTATGGVLGGALGKFGSKYSEAGVLGDFSKSNNSIIGNFKKGANELEESLAKGTDLGELAARKGINLANEYNPETLAYDTVNKSQGVFNDGLKLDSVLSNYLEKVPGTVSATDLETQINNKIAGIYKDKVTAAEAQNVVANEFNNIRNQYGENLPINAINDLKSRAWTKRNFDTDTNNLTRKVYGIMGNNMKTTVENAAKEKGAGGVAEMNQLIGAHFDLADVLGKKGLNGRKVPGGRLGDLMQKHALGAIGAGMGFAGGGIVPAILSGMAGEYASGKIARLTRYIMSSPLKTAILEQMQKEDPEVVQKIIQYAKQTPHGLEAIDEFLKSKGVGLFGNTPEKGVPLATPKVKKPGILPGLITTGAIRGLQPSSQ